MAVLIPAYREDRVIDQSVEAILAQQYPRERYEVVVIADHCAPRHAGTARTTARFACWGRIRKQFESQGAQSCRRAARRCG
ncbi:MAG: glycosyltransferase [Alistipes indistinctus]